MPNINPIAEGAKSLSEGINQAREAGKSLTKSIEDIQHDGVEEKVKTLFYLWNKNEYSRCPKSNIADCHSVFGMAFRAGLRLFYKTY